MRVRPEIHAVRKEDEWRRCLRHRQGGGKKAAKPARDVPRRHGNPLRRPARDGAARGRRPQRAFRRRPGGSIPRRSFRRCLTRKSGRRAAPSRRAPAGCLRRAGHCRYQPWILSIVWLKQPWILSSLPIEQPWCSISLTPTSGRIRPFIARGTVWFTTYKTVIYNLVNLRAGEGGVRLQHRRRTQLRRAGRHHPI